MGLGASLVAQMVKNLLTMWDIQVRSLGQEYPLEEEMTTHSSILAWEMPWTEGPGGLYLWDRKESDTTGRLNNSNNNNIPLKLSL